MGLSEKVMDALKAGILLNEKVTSLVSKVDRMDQDMHRMNERLIRIETVVEMTTMQKDSSKKQLR